MNRRTILIIVAAVIVLLGIGVYAWVRIIPRIPPSLNREYTITVDMPDEAKQILTKNVADTVTVLRENPQDVDSWFALAKYRKMGGDFKGSERIMQFLAATTDGDARATAFGNLGDLYMYFYKKYPAAERYYLDALALKPSMAQYYTDLHRMYAYAYKIDQNRAIQILLDGVDKVPSPEDYDLVVLLASYYVSIGQTDKAIETYQQARGIALAVNNQELADRILEEISRLVLSQQGAQQ